MTSLMKAADIGHFFATLQAANPHPETELEYSTPFELLTAVLLSAQATDVGVNKATRKFYPVANTPQQILDLGLEGLCEYIKTIGLYKSKAKHLLETCRILVDQHGGRVPRTREALEALAAGPHRRKVTLALDDVSVTDTLFGMFSKGELRPKYMEFPSAVYAMHPFDRVEKDGQLVGLSTWIGYSANEGKILTLAMVDESVAVPGTEVEFVWGEPDGGTSKPTVEPHRQVTIKAVVAAVPYSEVARTSYADSWRTQAAA